MTPDRRRTPTPLSMAMGNQQLFVSAIFLIVVR
jgi:hypothetical protein